jgi:hypothetical protein
MAEARTQRRRGMAPAALVVAGAALIFGSWRCGFDERNLITFDPQQSIGSLDPTLDAGPAGGEPSGMPGLGTSGGGVPELRLAPEALGFGPVASGFLSRQLVTITNVGRAALSERVVVDIATGGDPSFSVLHDRCDARLAPGESCEALVAFMPQAVGEVRAALRARASGANEVSASLDGSGLSRGPLTLGPVSGGGFDFGSVLLEAAGEQRFVVSNTADLPSGPLDVYLNSSAFSLLEPAQGGCMSTVTELQGAGRCELSVGFAPARRGPSEVTVTVDSALGAVSARLVGRGRAPAQLALSTDALDFEQVVLGQFSAGTARIENVGDEPLSLSSLGLAGEHVGDFAIQDSDCGSGTSLAGSGRCSVALEFRPVTSAGLRSAALQVTSGTGSSLDVALRGEALALGSLRIEGLDALAGSTVESASGSVLANALGNFGATRVDEVDTRAFRITNPSAQPSGALSLSTGGDFSLASPPAAGDCQPDVTSLVNGESCTLSVSFVPTRRDVSRSTLLVSSPLAGSASLPLFGAGTVPGRWASAQRELDFGHLVVGTTSSNTLTLHNGGDEPTTALEASLSGALGGDDANFSFDASGCARPLAPGESCSLAVHFSPREPATQWATLQLASGGASATSVLLFGEAVSAGNLVVAGADALAPDFGDVQQGTIVSRTFTITNPGTLDSGALTVTVSGQDGSFTLSDIDCAATGPRGLLQGASCSVTVSFQPIGSGPANANLLVSSAAVGSTGLPLSGRGRTPPSLVATSNRSFGTANLGSATLTEDSNQFVWTLTNEGDLGSGPLQIANDNPTEFVVLDDSCSGVALEGLASCQIGVRFQPNDAGQRRGELRVTDGMSGASVSLAMSGTGVRVAQPGQSCINATCASGTCTAGVCCDRDCSATCQACSAAGVCIDQQNRESCGSAGGQCFGVNRCQLPAGQRCSAQNGDAQCGDGNCEVRLGGQGNNDRICCLESCAGGDQCNAQTGRCQAPALSQGAACGAAGQPACAAGLVCKPCLNGGNQCTPADGCCGGCALDQRCEAGQCQCPVQSNGRREVHCGGGRCITDRLDACCDTASSCDGNQICDGADDLCRCPAGSRECVANSNECVPNNQCCTSCGACATCNGGACANLSRGSQGQCGAGQRCDGNGACFTPQCTEPSQCGDCRTCSSNLTCTQAPQRTPCSQSRLCTAGGQCVQCINSTDCPTGQTCNMSNVCVNSCTPSTEVCDGRDNDCDGQIDDNPDVSSDPNNCGACGRSCQGGTCSGGQCQPFALVSGRTSPNDILVDNNNVYWIDSAGVNRFPKNGGGNSIVTTITSSGALSLQRDGSTLYWGASNDVFRAAVTATSADNFLPNQAGNITAVYHTPGFVYWGEDRGAAGSGFRSTAVARANLQTLATLISAGQSGTGSRPLGVQGECSWSAEPEADATIFRGCPGSTGLNDGLVNAFFSLVVRGIHISGPQITDVYIGALGRGVVRLGSGQIPEAVIVASTGPMGAVLRDGDFVYFVDGASATPTCTANGILSRVTTGGQNRTALSAAQSCLAKVAVDNTAIYWTNFQSGQIMKLAKPQ